MYVFKLILHYLAMFFTWIVLICAAVLVISGLFGYKPYIIMSGSMEPTVQTGSLTYVNTNDRDCEVDDIIAFTLENGTTVVHRIVAYDEDTDLYITKGDANDTSDGDGIEESAIIGTVSLTIPKIGYLLDKLEEPRIELGNVVIPAPILYLICFLIALNIIDYLFLDEKNRR